MFPPGLALVRAGARVADAARRSALLPWRLRQMAAVELEPTPYEVVYRENRVRLRHYEPTGGTSRSVPIVIAYAFVNTPAILDLLAERSVVGQFTDRGFDVYVVDWGDPSTIDVHLTLSDFVCRYLKNCVDEVRERSGADAVHLLGCSTGAPLGAAFAALFPERVATLILQGPPLDFDAEDGMFAFRDVAERHDLARGVDPAGNVPAEVVDLGFSLRKPADYAIGRYLEAFDRLDDEEYLERAVGVARWAADGPDFAGTAYSEFIERLLVGNELIEGRLELCDRRVDLANIAMPVALIVGAEDSFVPHEASLPFLDAIPSEDTAVFEFPSGHVGTFVDRSAHEEWWPRVCDWLVGRS